MQEFDYAVLGMLHFFERVFSIFNFSFNLCVLWSNIDSWRILPILVIGIFLNTNLCKASFWIGDSAYRAFSDRRQSQCCFRFTCAAIWEKPASFKYCVHLSCVKIRIPLMIPAHFSSFVFLPSDWFTIINVPPGFSTRQTSWKPPARNRPFQRQCSHQMSPLQRGHGTHPPVQSYISWSAPHSGWTALFYHKRPWNGPGL